MIKYLLCFKNMPLFHLWVLAVYYFFQGIFGFFVYDFDIAFEFFLIFCVTCFLYFLFFNMFSSAALRIVVNSKSRLSVDFDYFLFFVFGLYVAMISYVSVTSDQIALIQAIQGASISELAESRERFLRTREGWEALLPYMNAVLVMALLPYCLATLFYLKHRFRFFYFVVFLFCLSLTLEKSLAILVFLPIVVIAFNGKNDSGGIRVLIIFLAFLISVSFLARGGLQDGNSSIEATDSAATMPDGYKIFDCDDQLCYLGNRVLWIPYATAIDWLRYHKTVLDGEFVLGASTGMGSLVFNVKKIDLEKEVFGFQWGQNETGTGSSNAAYFIDAYVNFSWGGVFLYSLIVALFSKIFYVSDNVPLKAVCYVSLFYLAVNSLPPMLTSGGLLVILFICLFLKPGQR